MPPFLCDEMLTGLGRWLRAAGHDALCSRPGTPDGELVGLAKRDGRLLLTRDRRLLDRRDAQGRALLLTGGSLDLWAAQLRKMLGLSWRHAPFSRCLLCNQPLDRAAGVAMDRVPSWAMGGRLMQCRTCDKVYWPGGHVSRMAAHLERWERGEYNVPGA